MIEVIPETGSTSTDLLARLAGGENVPEGHWLVADRQVAGRGRQGRAWFDGGGNFMGSCVVHLRPGDPPAGTLALVAGLALHEVAAPRIAPPPRAELKWPNDLMVGRAKLAGILLERAGDAVVVGIGVNLSRAPQVEGRVVATMADYGPAPDRDHFANELAARFAEEVACWRSGGLGPLLSRWMACAHPLGTALEAGDAGGKAVQGTFAGLAPDGALQLRLADGTHRVIHAGEVRLS